MIEDILRRRFVTGFGEDLAAAFAAGEPQRRRGEELPEGAEDLTPEDFAAAARELAQALAAENSGTSGQPGFESTAERRSDVGRTIDDVGFISRDPVIGNLQAVIEEYYEERHPERIEGEDSPGGRRSAGGGGDETISGRRLKVDGGRRLLGAFEQTDIRWIKCLFAMAIKKLKGAHPFNPVPGRSQLPGDAATILVVGDWGSGVPRARRVAEQMQSMLAQPSATPRHAIHLGDIYYAGTKRECRNRFLKYWPVKPEWATSIPSWNLNGNHDMYAGGYGYFETVLADPRFAGQQRSSLFTISNRYWRVIGLDTAYENAALKAPQPSWITQEVVEARAQGQKVLLLSHHQLFSAYEKGSPKIATALAPILSGAGIDAWLWGHEHRCVFYKAGNGVRAASCVGHGGVPVWQAHGTNDPYPPNVSYEYRDAIQKGPECFARFGFAVLELQGPNIGVKYITEDGVTDHVETIR